MVLHKELSTKGKLFYGIDWRGASRGESLRQTQLDNQRGGCPLPRDVGPTAPFPGRNRVFICPQAAFSPLREFL
jgi:hypothetical protein